jgi:hypothetical protein
MFSALGGGGSNHDSGPDGLGYGHCVGHLAKRRTVSRQPVALRHLDGPGCSSIPRGASKQALGVDRCRRGGDGPRGHPGYRMGSLHAALASQGGVAGR